MITIGRMAEKYHMLPSHVEQNATTYDFMITDVLATYEQYLAAKNCQLHNDQRERLI